MNSKAKLDRFTRWISEEGMSYLNVHVTSLFSSWFEGKMQRQYVLFSATIRSKEKISVFSLDDGTLMKYSGDHKILESWRVRQAVVTVFFLFFLSKGLKKSQVHHEGLDFIKPHS